jgi:hypothetical protein
MKQIHEYASLFPAIEGAEFEALCKDIKEHGLNNPIVTYEGKVLDGVNRDRACEKTGVKPRYEDFRNSKSDPLDFVVSQNVHRRQLTGSQRAILALELEKKIKADDKAKGKKPGSGPRSETDRGNPTRGNQAIVRAAKALKIGRASVEDAKRLAKAAPHMVSAVRSGKVSLTEALREARGNRAQELARKHREAQTRDHLQKNNRQVAEYIEAAKAFSVAIRVAHESSERFSKEAFLFVQRRNDEIRKLMTEFEKEIKA